VWLVIHEASIITSGESPLRRASFKIAFPPLGSVCFSRHWSRHRYRWIFDSSLWYLYETMLIHNQVIVQNLPTSLYIHQSIRPPQSPLSPIPHILFHITLHYKPIPPTRLPPHTPTLNHHHPQNPKTPTATPTTHPHPHPLPLPSAPAVNPGPKYALPLPFPPSPPLGAANPSVTPPTTTAVPEAARLTSTPLSVAAAPPGMSVCPPAIYACAEAVLAVRVCEPSVRTGALPGGTFWVWVPTMSAVAEGAREMGVEFMLMGEPPGVRVWEPKM